MTGRTGRPGEEFPASALQEQMWLTQGLRGGDNVYTTSEVLRISGVLDEDRLRRALAGLRERHAILRAGFRTGPDGLRQIVEKDCPVDLRVLPPAARSAHEEEFLTQLDTVLAEPFDLTEPPLWRCVLGRAGETSYLALVMQHMLTDAWSFGLLLSDLGRLCAGESLPPAGPSFPELAARQRERLARTGPGLREWWRENLAGAPARSPFTTPSGYDSYRGRRLRVALDPGTVRSVQETAGALGITPYLLWLTAAHLLLARHGGQPDTVVGLPAANRLDSAEEAAVGPFVNQLPLRVRLPERVSPRAAAEAVTEAVLDAVEHQELPFGEIVRAAGAAPLEHGLNPLFQLVVVQRDPDAVPREFAGLPASRLEAYTGTAKYQLVITFPAGPGDPWLGLEYDTGHFGHAFAERLGRELGVLAAGIAAGPDREIPLRADAAHLERIAGLPLHERFAAVAAAQPRTLAIAEDGGGCTYAELDARAAELSAGVRAEGVGPGDIVAVALPPGVDFVATCLAVLRAGAAYLPVDDRWPVERIAQVLADADAALLVAGRPLPGAWTGRVRRPDELREREGPGDGEPPRVPADALAYVIYTSGSTGRPKGVMVEHASVARFCAPDQRFAPRPGDRVPQVSSIAFDASVYEVWATLLNGATLLVPGSRSLGPGEYARLLDNSTVAMLTSGLFGELVRHGGCAAALRRVRMLLVGGDRVEPGTLAGFDRPDQLRLNVYGPTETTVLATTGPLDARSPAGRVPIGTAVAGNRTYVLDAELRRVPPGEAGELHIAGSGVARGYLGDPALTHARFRPDPWCPGERMYATGDRVRLLADGALEFLGRVDDQVKIRGFRVELGEIEAVLRTDPRVETARAAIHRTAEGRPRLIAAVRPAPGAPEGPRLAAELRTLLGARLPDFMQPQELVAVAEFPLNTNGKLDLPALLAAPAPGAAPEPEPVAGPASDLARMAALWTRVLAAPAGAEDNFFALGGDSLAALRLLAACPAEFGAEPSLADLFEAADLRAFTHLVSDLAREGSRG